MTIWQDVTTAALLGTERQPFRVPSALGPLGGLLGRLPTDSEAALLSASAIIAQANRAGALPPVTDLAPPPPCPLDEQPVCSERVADGLRLITGGRYKEALSEMLMALANTNKRVPERLLPDLLKQGRQLKELRAAILPVLGRRGRWLAAQNRDWAWADQQLLETAASPEQIWAEGNQTERRAALQQLRGTEAASALALLQTTWASESAVARIGFLSALETNLGPADEIFLEAALDDRSKDVRRQAADLLARLPESQYVGRMIARAAPFIKPKRSLLGGFSLEVALPTEWDKSMERDGIEPKSSDSKIGEKAWWLCQIIASIPPNYWVKTWQKTPAEIWEAAGKTEWALPLQRGWETAVQRQPDSDWLETLIRAHQNRQESHHLPQTYQAALITLPEARLEKLILETLRPQKHLFGVNAPVPLHDSHPALALLQSHTRPWSIELSRAVVESIQRRIVQGAGKDERLWSLTHSLKQFAYFIPPQLVTEFAEGWPEIDSSSYQWQNSIQEFVSTLHFRQELLREIG